MPDVRIEHETETPRGWSYRIAVTRAGGVQTAHEVRLAWVDHDHLCGGSLPPSKLVELIITRMLELAGDAPIPERFDISTARRMFPDLDLHVGGRI